MRQALAGMADALDFDAGGARRHEDGGLGGVHERRRPRLRRAATATSRSRCSSTSRGLTIVVRDQGSGIDRDAPRSDDVPALGLGLPLIAALSDAFELRGERGQGTEVRMTFRYSRDGDPAAGAPGPGRRRQGRPLGPGGGARHHHAAELRAARGGAVPWTAKASAAPPLSTAPPSLPLGPPAAASAAGRPVPLRAPLTRAPPHPLRTMETPLAFRRTRRPRRPRLDPAPRRRVRGARRGLT